MAKPKSKSHYIIPVFVPDLGCPHQCVFCNQKKITGQNEVPSREEVAGKITEYLDTIPGDSSITREVAFYGGSCTAVSQELQRELLTPAYKFLAAGKIDGIRVSTRPDAVDEDKLSLLSGYGVQTVELGVQSMDDEVLAKAGRGHTSRDVIRAAALVKAWGMELGFQIILGLPGDTEEKETDSALELIALKPDLVRIYPCLVLRGTQLAQLYEKGEYSPLSVEQAVQRSKKLLVMFENAGINVIRIGLQPSEQISLDGEVIAGPYHPAFRELVESALARDMLEYLLADKLQTVKPQTVKLQTVKLQTRNEHTVEIAVPQQDISVVRGHKGSNVEYFREKYSVSELKTVVDNTLLRGTVKLVSVDGNKFDSIVDRARLPVLADK